MTLASMTRRERLKAVFSNQKLYEAMRAELLPGATRRPHVCFVAPDIWPVFSGAEDAGAVGGAELQQSILARALAGIGYRVSIICSDYGQPARVERDGVTLVRTFRPHGGIPLLRLIHPRLTRLWAAMRKVDADIYYQRAAGKLTAIVAMYCRQYGKRAIYAGASDRDFIPGRHFPGFGGDRWLFERGLRMVDAIVVQNHNQQALCAEHFDRDATLIPNCYRLPADTARPIAAGARDHVLWLAGIRRNKRPELLFEIARRLPHRRFIMIGGPAGADQADLAYFEQVRQAAGQLPNLDFLGALPLAKTEPYFDHAAVVVDTMAADSGYLPNVFLQAWARGITTIAFFDATHQPLGDPVYPVVSDPDSATAAIEQIYTDELHRLRISRRCLEYFNHNHACDAVLAQYRQLLDALYRDGRQ
jgi:glycosyltransferase involved in cell wall biosynthesis